MDHVAHLKRLGLRVDLKVGETICAGYQRKFAIDGVQSRFARTGFAGVAIFADSEGWYAMTLFKSNHV